MKRLALLLLVLAACKSPAIHPVRIDQLDDLVPLEQVEREVVIGTNISAVSTAPFACTFHQWISRIGYGTTPAAAFQAAGRELMKARAPLDANCEKMGCDSSCSPVDSFQASSRHSVTAVELSCPFKCRRDSAVGTGIVGTASAAGCPAPADVVVTYKTSGPMLKAGNAVDLCCTGAYVAAYREFSAKEKNAGKACVAAACKPTTGDVLRQCEGSRQMTTGSKPAWDTECTARVSAQVYCTK